MSGASSNWPFLYQGMEHESIDPSPYYYSGDGAYYSAQIMRSMSTTSALGRTSPSGGDGGIVGGDGMALSGMTNAAALAEQVAFQYPTEAGGASAPSGNSGDGGLILYWFEQFGNDLADLFGGGGGSSLPPNYYVFQHRLNRPHGGRHPLYTVYIGVGPGIVVGMGGVRLVSAGGAPSGEQPLLAPQCQGGVILVADFGGSHDPEFWKKGPMIEPWMFQKWARLRGGRKVIPMRPTPPPAGGTDLIDPFPWFFLPGAYCQFLADMHLFDPACGNGAS
jgi:hypothetical protein